MDDAEIMKKRVDADLKPTQVQIHAQYVKDFSFENPHAPESLKMAEGRPEMDVNLVLDAVKINDDQISDLYESTLTLKVKSMRGDQVLFISEISYSALVSFKDTAQTQGRYILYVEVPQMLFPFARQMLANAVSAGGMPPLLLNPIDFRAMYESNLKRTQGEAA